MIKNSNLLAQFEKKQLRKEKLTYLQALKLMESLWREGIALGALPPKNPLEGIETDIRIARILNKCSGK